MSRIADDYAEGTARAWDRKMAQETADEQRAEVERAYWTTRPHRYVADEFVLRFCARCGIHRDRH